VGETKHARMNLSSIRLQSTGGRRQRKRVRPHQNPQAVILLNIIDKATCSMPSSLRRRYDLKDHLGELQLQRASGLWLELMKLALDVLCGRSVSMCNWQVAVNTHYCRQCPNPHQAFLTLKMCSHA